MGADGRPEFARDFPRVASVDGLVEAFARGDYGHVRTEGRRLAGSDAEPEDVRRAARTLIERTQPDPLAVWLLVIAGALLLALTAYWVAHGQAPPRRAPPPAAPSSSS
ncbi:MAG TPA: hypothetical protein VGM06_00890 [Polyangiaceae bacterium]|jgi:hypothetical protein